MKIICTEAEKQALINTLARNPRHCPFDETPAVACKRTDCELCVEENVAWDIEENTLTGEQIYTIRNAVPEGTKPATYAIRPGLYVVVKEP